MPLLGAQSAKAYNRSLDEVPSRMTGFLVEYAAPYLAIFEQGGSADIFSRVTWGGGEMTLLRAL